MGVAGSGRMRCRDVQVRDAGTWNGGRDLLARYSRFVLHSGWQGPTEDQKARVRLEAELDRMREELLRWAGGGWGGGSMCVVLSLLIKPQHF